MKAQNSTNSTSTQVTQKVQNLKRAKQFKQFLRLMNELNHDVYICVQDKKRGSVHHFSSDINKFGNLHIVQATKDTPVQKIETFTKHLTKMMDTLPSQTEKSEACCTSKKDTEASSQELKSEFSKFMTFDQESSDGFFGHLDHKSSFGLASPKMTSLLSQDLLASVEVHNEMSYPGYHNTTSLFDFNQVNIEDSPLTLEELGGTMFATQLHGSKKYSEDEIALRVDSRDRRSFAHRQLFKSGASLHQDDFEASDDYSPNEYSAAGCDYDGMYSHESSLNPSACGSNSDSIAVNASPMVRRGYSMMPPVMEIFSDDESDHDYYEDDETDLFFCCADWESQVKQAEQEQEQTPVGRRQSKAWDKLHLTDKSRNEDVPEFDVDLFMQKPSYGSCGKLLGKRKPRALKTSPKKVQKLTSFAPPSLSSFLDQQPGSAAGCPPVSQPFENVCLSPMGAHSPNLFQQKA